MILSSVLFSATIAHLLNVSHLGGSGGLRTQALQAAVCPDATPVSTDSAPDAPELHALLGRAQRRTATPYGAPHTSLTIYTYGDSDLVSRRIQRGTIGFEPGLHYFLTHAMDVAVALRPRHDAAAPWLLDVGAHIGVHSLAFAARRTPVLAFEPFPTTVARLLCSKAAGGDALASLVVVPAAAWSTTGGSPVRMDSYPANTAVAFTVVEAHADALDEYFPNMLGRASAPRSTTQPALPPQSESRPSRQFLVPTVALDDVFAANPGLPPPLVVKVDVEGGEGHVLRGWAATLAAWTPAERPPVLVVEINAFLAEVQGFNAVTDVATPLVRNYGYRMWRGDLGARGYPEMTPRITNGSVTLQQLFDEGRDCEFNFVFLAGDVADAILAALPRDVFAGDESSNACG